MSFSYIVLDPPLEIFHFNLPLINRPILWYGFFFALGFFLGYLILLYLLKQTIPLSLQKEIKPKVVAEHLVLYTLVGLVLGARIGDVLFYQSLSDYASDPLSIFKFWQGGLASHGGALGVMVALLIFCKKYQKSLPLFSWTSLLDLLAMPAALLGSCIRIGNFFNQEVLGKESDLPWAVAFGHPVAGKPFTPRHPVQIYESLYYMLVFFLLLYLWKTKSFWRKKGKICGSFFILIFSFRFFIEFFKMEQSVLLSAHSFLTMGQYLSIPFVFLGIFLLDLFRD